MRIRLQFVLVVPEPVDFFVLNWDKVSERSDFDVVVGFSNRHHTRASIQENIIGICSLEVLECAKVCGGLESM